MRTFEMHRNGVLDSLSRGWTSIRRNLDRLALGMFVTSAVALAVAPVFLPPSYSWVENTVSESAGQGVRGAWLVRSGVLLTSLAAVLLSVRARGLWNRSCRTAFRFYAFALLGVAFFADGPWNKVPYNRSEAFFHTFSAFWAAVGFALGVLAVNRTRSRDARLTKAFDWVVALGTGMIPVAMLVFLGQAGLLQRLLAVAGYTWLILETVRIARFNEVLARPYRRTS